MNPDQAARADALVVFGGQADLKWLRFLKPGFRHCFVALRRGDIWLIYNPLSHQTEIEAYPDSGGYDLARWFRSQGHAVIPWSVRQAPKRAAPWRPYTCVEAVKRVLGLRSIWVFTPFQLYNYLINNKLCK